MTKNEVIQESAQLITRDFNLEPSDYSTITKSELLEKLEGVVQHFLDKDLNQLLNILYRIDIAESDVKRILTTVTPDEMSKKLAEKILDRQLKKAETRIRYRS